MKRVAILGASGQIGKGLTLELMREHELLLFARDTNRAKTFLSTHQAADSSIEVLPLQEFGKARFDAVVNAIGPGDPRLIRAMGAEIFRVTERFDNLVLDHLERYPDTIYVNLSTGAVYGKTYTEAATERSRFTMAVNRMGATDFYPLAKLAAEAKHRGLAELSIADVRIFGYFSRHIDVDGGFFLSQLSNCVIEAKTFRTNSTDFVRDYISSDDLSSFVSALLKGRGGNGAYDIYSASPVTKFELLEELGRAFGLCYEIDERKAESIARVEKPRRISEHDAAETIGYVPRRTSLEVVLRELKAISTSSRDAETSAA